MTAMLSLALISAAAGDSSAGFLCIASDQSTMQLNIDLKRERYDSGDGIQKIERITDTKITLRGPNPFLLSDTSGLGPILTSLELDRRTLVLTDQTLMPGRGINRSIQYQCELGPPIDFKAGRRF